MEVALRQFHAASDEMAANRDQRAYLRQAMGRYETARARSQGRFRDWEQARSAAAAIKRDAIARLGEHLVGFTARLESRGVHVHFAETGDDACSVIRDIARRREAKLIVKSKSMTTEEIHLNPALEADGYEVVETDLGEFIVQIRGEPPYHIVAPAMHLRREAISEDFHRVLKEPRTTDAAELTMQARRALRQKYLRADIGITGCNFAVAETGMIAITENEGNARLTCGLPAVHIVVVGIEKIVPRFSDLALMLPLLATAGTGQHMSCYNTMISGPRRDDEFDGPQEMHVILLDNRRTAMLADERRRDALCCIRCGACLNVCPIFRNVGGHAYGTTYQGPIGSVITPHLRDLRGWSHLSSASSLCGACTATCPVRIDLHHLLLHNRAAARRQHAGVGERMAMRMFSFVMCRPRLYRLLSRFARPLHLLSRPLHGSRIDPIHHWRRSRTLPAPPGETFHQWWKRNAAPAKHDRGDTA